MNDPKPVVPSGIMTEFGPLLDDPKTLMDEMGMNRDMTYVPGFSDLRRAADLVRAENGRDGGNRPVPALPVNLRWARRTRASGVPDNSRIVAHQRSGYRPVTEADKGKEWLTDLPAGCSVLPDGTIGNADMQLMVCDQRTAARNEASKRLRWMELNTASQEEAIRKASSKVKGSTVEVTTELGPATSS